MQLPPAWPFRPVVELPRDCPVLDMSTGSPVPESELPPFAIGRYDERRPGVYPAALFGPREWHMGIDLFAPAGTPVRAFAAGWVHLFGYNGAPGDYGYTLITRHELGRGVELFALHGHLAARSIEGKRAGQEISAGETMAWLGEKHENGGWPPHLHFQLSYERPTGPDLPGVVSTADRMLARLRFPDPRLVLGPLY